MNPSTPSEPVVLLERVLVRAAGRTLLQLPLLAIQPGERVAIVGANGAGKTTLLKLISGLLPAQQGRVRVLGRELGRESASEMGPGAAAALSAAQWRGLRRELGLLMQGPHLVPRLSARENVLVGALGRLQGRQAWRSWARLYPLPLLAEADAALAALGLAEHAHTRADRLSGGERQKLSLARLSLQRARLILADEPTAALDPSATTSACAALCAAAEGGTLITVLHQRELLPALATRVLALAQGRLVWDLPVAALDDATFAALYEKRAAADPSNSPKGSAWSKAFAAA